jgi:hypothetical protein
MAYSQPTSSPTVNSKACIYAAKEVPPLKALLLALAPTAKIFEEHAGDVTNFTCAWPDVTVRLTIKPHWDGPVERPGMKRWISELQATGQNTPAVESLLHKIDATVTCMGSVITPRFDLAGKASTLVTRGLRYSTLRRPVHGPNACEKSKRV